jgi:hypothetical protein
MRAQPAPQNVLERKSAQVSDVDEIVNGGPAGVHPHRVIGERSEILHLLRKSVVEPQGHREVFFYGSPGAILQIEFNALR